VARAYKHHFTEGRQLKTAASIERAIRRRDWFYWGGALRGRPKHFAVVAGMPFIYVCDVARRGHLYLAKPTAHRRKTLAWRKERDRNLPEPPF
jgi:hypothetical protein